MTDEQAMQEIGKINRDPLPKRSKEEIKILAKNLLEKMTLEEKIGQMYQSGGPSAHLEGVVEKNGDSVLDYIKQGNVGSIIGMTDPVEIYKVQKTAVDGSRLGIPLFFAYDIIHGCHTGFPVNLALSCSFDENLIEEVSRAAAKEMSRIGINLTYSPMVDVVRDPRWGRVVESNGEDPYLSGVLGKAYVRGYQQGDLTNYDSVAACVKHYAAYGASEAGRDYNTVDMSDRHLRMYYLPPYKACVEEGVASVMSSFNIVDGIPASANKYLLTDILRDEWGFEGFVISDFTSTTETIHHKVAANEKDAAEICVKAGLDHELIGLCYLKHLKELVEDGSVDESLVNRACLRMLEFKYRLGIFDNPYKNIFSKDGLVFEGHRQLALTAAQKSAVLLKNDGALPVSIDKKVALIGPGAMNRNLISAWGGLARNEECVTLEEGFKNNGFNFSVHMGCSFQGDGNDERMIEEAFSAAKNADVLVLAIGEPENVCGESHSRASISLSGNQKLLVEKLKILNKPMIGLIFSGRPLDLVWYEKQLDGILQVWYLGHEMGNAVASIVKGEINPSGKLSMTFPYTLGQVPVYYNHYNTGRPSDTGGPNDLYKTSFLDIPNAPLYPFGHGLSYTTFEYSKITMNKTRLANGETLEVSVDVKNAGTVFGEEIVQLYIEALKFSVTRPVKELKRFRKIGLASKETKKVKFEITTDDLAFLDRNNVMTAEKTSYRIYLGGSSATDNYGEINVIA